MTARMTARQAKQLLGQTGVMGMDTGQEGSKLYIEIKIVDIREVFGRVDFLVTPIAGSGQVWKAQHNVRIERRTSDQSDDATDT